MRLEKKPVDGERQEEATRKKTGDGVLPSPPVSSLPPLLLLPTLSSSSGDIGNEAQEGKVTHFHKLEYPTFDGKEDPLPWLNRCEQFFRGQCIPEEDRVWLASFQMVGAAQLWYYCLECDVGEPS